MKDLKIMVFTWIRGVYDVTCHSFKTKTCANMLHPYDALNSSFLGYFWIFSAFYALIGMRLTVILGR